MKNKQTKKRNDDDDEGFMLDVCGVCFLAVFVCLIMGLTEYLFKVV